MTDDSLLPVSVLDVHLAVVSGRPGQAEGGAFSMSRPVIYGTAFPIAPGLFVTARHVFDDARADGEVALVHLRPDKTGVHVVEDAELFDGLDLALLKCLGLRDLVPLPLDFDNRLTIFDEVDVLGFPFSIDPDHLTWVHRGFRGHVVTSREMYHLRSQPPGYELSIVPPPGTSGAPLVSTKQGSHMVYGYVVHRYVNEIADVTTSLGIAVMIEVLLSLKSAIVGGPMAGIFGRPPQEPRPPTPIRRNW